VKPFVYSFPRPIEIAKPRQRPSLTPVHSELSEPSELKAMNIIHFARGATDPLKGFDAEGAHYVPLADGHGDTHLSCVHLESGATINAPSLTHAAALLVVHGCITITRLNTTTNINVHAGMGAVFEPQEPYTFNSEPGAILIVVEAEHLLPHERGISLPERIAGQAWPSDRTLTT
jgi:hypothetical protein